jgi:hypothetical protein
MTEPFCRRTPKRWIFFVTVLQIPEDAEEAAENGAWAWRASYGDNRTKKNVLELRQRSNILFWNRLF